MVYSNKWINRFVFGALISILVREREREKERKTKDD
jgi:hypothetical protein